MAMLYYEAAEFANLPKARNTQGAATGFQVGICVHLRRDLRQRCGA
jgi:hypothetical protein